MNFFRSGKSKIAVTKEESLVETSSADEARRIADIVANGIDNGNFLEISNELKQLSEADTGKQKYVFERPKKSYRIISMIFELLLFIAFIFFAVVSVGTVILSNEYRLFGAVGFGIAIAIIVLNAIALSRTANELKFFFKI
jgi:hypothetical protein